jgi:tetratricopeptide (TPR) repeat protein
MAYVRRRGNQLAIVHGERDPRTGKVQQRILFTLYSKAEALEVLGRRKKSPIDWFCHLLERQYSDIKFDWKEIRRAIEQNLDALPDLYEYRSERLRSRFRNDLCAFTRALILADPQDLISAAHLIREHRYELEYLADLITWRLKLCDQKESQWNADNPFYWRLSLRGGEVPSDTEEHAAGFYERGEYEKAEAIFRLLVDCFDRYAEGYNYLGLIALQRWNLDEAIRHFKKTVELGRRLFPARITKKRYWSDLSTRPFMRGLRNLAMALNIAGNFEDALATCDRLADECADEWTATRYRADVYLNTLRWEEAADASQKLLAGESAAGFFKEPHAGFTAAFALFELGQNEDALRSFLYAALNFPRTARMLVGNGNARGLPPKFADEVEDHNAGVFLMRGLHAYLKDQARSSRDFFQRIATDARVAALVDEIVDVVRRWHKQPSAGDHEAFQRMQLMHSREFANSEASKLRDLAVVPRSAPVGIKPRRHVPSSY